MPVAIVTGASRGLGLALAAALAEEGWDLVVDARGEPALRAAAEGLRGRGARVRAIPGDVADAEHRRALVAAAEDMGGLDLLVNNASLLGPSPLPRLEALPLDALESVLAANLLAPLGLVQSALPLLRASGGRIVNLSSDAAVEAYPGWGGYGAAKAALDLVSAVLAEEHPELRVYAVDPGDMRTAMHQAAYPGEDISDRASPEERVPALLRLAAGDLPSGRYRAADLAASEPSRT